MELTGSWPHSQQPTTCPCLPPYHFLKSHFNIILSTTPQRSKCSLYLRSPHQLPACPSPIPHTCHMPCPSHSSCFDHPNNTAWFKRMDSILYVCISWIIHGMWMIYITFERGGPKFSNTTARALPSAQPCSSISWEQNGYYVAQDFLRSSVH